MMERAVDVIDLSLSLSGACLLILTLSFSPQPGNLLLYLMFSICVI